MSHMKNKILNAFKKHPKATLKSCCSVNSLTADCKCCKHHNNTDGQHKMKRLKSRKERSQMRGSGREASKTKSHYHHQSSRNVAHFHSCCHNICVCTHCTSRKEEPYPNRIPAAQEPSIITDNRLIGHHGLFNREVKSVDIERLLSEQRKQEKSEEQVPEKSCILSHPSSTSHNPSPFSSKDLSGGNTNEAAHFAKVADPAANAQECWEKDKTLSQGSDVTPGQRLRQELDPSSGSYKSIFSSKHSSLDVDAFKSKKNCVISERCTESPLSPTGDKDNVKKLNKKLKTQMISSPDHTPKQEMPLILPAQASGLRPSPRQLSTSPITQSFNVTRIRQDPGCVLKSVSEFAARLCDGLHFPFLRRGNLLTESREEVLRALQERHGPQLRENLLKVKRSLICGADLTRAVGDEDVLFPADAPEFQTDNSFQFCFDTQRPQKTPEWLTDSMDTSTSLLDGILRPSCSPTVYMHSDPPEVSANDNLFSHSTTSCWAEKSSSSQHWRDSFSRSKNKESFLCDSFENSYLNHSRAERRRLQYSGNNIQPIFTHTAKLTERRSAEPGPFVTDGCSHYQCFSPQCRLPCQSNNFRTFSQFTQPSTCPPPRPHNADMVHYPPSDMLERETAPPFSSLPSPEPWSFPPMRLY